MARPPDSDSPRTKTVAVRLTDSEIEALDRRAGEGGMTRSAYARSLLVNQPAVGKVNPREWTITFDDQAVYEAGQRLIDSYLAGKLRPPPNLQPKVAPRQPAPAPAALGVSKGHGPNNCPFPTHPIGHGKIACKTCDWSGTP